jgi:hypothetical protein
MATKEYYRQYFVECMPYVKLAAVLRDLGESKQNFSKFMKGSYYDHYMSLDKLDKIYNHLHNVLTNLT